MITYLLQQKLQNSNTKILVGLILFLIYMQFQTCVAFVWVFYQNIILYQCNQDTYIYVCFIKILVFLNLSKMWETEDDLLVEISRTLLRVSPVLVRMDLLRKPARISETVCR